MEKLHLKRIKSRCWQLKKVGLCQLKKVASSIDKCLSMPYFKIDINTVISSILSIKKLDFNRTEAEIF